MNPTIIKEMEPHIRQRYHFATSAFARIFGVPKVTEQMQIFCMGWAKTDEVAPLDCLHHVDRYFNLLWNNERNR